ncbi:O-antigen polymerase [Vibrio cholerae]
MSVSQFYKKNNRFFVLSSVILLPWFIVFIVRYLGPITHPEINFETSFFFTSVIYVIYVFFIAGYVAAYYLNFDRNSVINLQRVLPTAVNVGKVFYTVRFFVVVMAILYPVISFVDFFVVKGASLSTIVEQREAEHLTGPRNSLIGAVGALLSGSPPILFVILGIEKFKNRISNVFIYLFIFLGVFSMFLSGGRNAFFISLMFVVIYRFLFPMNNVKSRKSFTLIKFFPYILVLYCIYFSMKMFLDRFEAQGFEVSYMLDYLQREYNILIYRPEIYDFFLVSLYSIFVYLSFYISHAFTYLNEYFIISYSPYMGGVYNFPQLARLIDVAAGTDFFAAGFDRMILTGVYLTLPGSLYLDFGIAGTLLICLLMGYSLGYLCYNISNLALYQRLFLTYLCVACVFSPIYSIFGMANGFSLIFIILFIMVLSVKVRY